MLLSYPRLRKRIINIKKIIIIIKMTWEKYFIRLEK